MENRIYSFLGLAMKAGKVRSGDFACESTIKVGKARLVIVAGDAADNTKKNFSDMCKFYEVDLRFFGEKEFLGRYVGKEKRATIAITGEGFASKLMQMIDDLNQKSGGGIIG